jgi:hypothetical protein
MEKRLAELFFITSLMWASRAILNESKWQNKERKYFDSGDFALTATGKATENGVLNTGEIHPHRESIWRPHASVPGSSNVQEDANENLQDQKSDDFVMTESPLHQHTDQQSTKTANSESRKDTEQNRTDWIEMFYAFAAH